MAKKKKKIDTSRITKEQLLKMDKKAHRDAMISVGQRITPANKVHKTKKDYTRKPKHKKPPGNDDTDDVE